MDESRKFFNTTIRAMHNINRAKKGTPNLLPKLPMGTPHDLMLAIQTINNPADARKFYKGYIHCLQFSEHSIYDRYRPEHVAKENIRFCISRGIIKNDETRYFIWSDIINAE